ncbi:MAG: PspC domain-containing protein [Bacillota bacterium]|nr:PspC domain-containing protein [Bacillota bacterium]
MKRLYRSKVNNIIGGVCGGLAEYLDIDPTIVRLAWILSAFAGGLGLLAYIVAWLIIPPHPEHARDDDWHWANRVKQNGERTETSYDVDPSTADTAPAAAGGGEELSHARVHREHGPRTLGIVLVILGGFLLLRNLMPWWGWGRFWPLALVLIGAWIILTAVRGER